MKKKLFILVSILALSCNKDEIKAPPDKTALNLVTGINFRQDEDATPIKLGNPNVLINDKFSIFPNPVVDVAYIFAQDNVTDVWIVPANPQKIYQDINFSSVLNTNLYSEQSIDSHSTFSLNEQSSNNVHMNIVNLPKGYYRVFVKIGGEIYCDNLYKSDDQGLTEDLITSITNFWN